MNKNSNDICSDSGFWITKFQHDELPFLYINKPLTINEWLDEYFYIHNLSLQAMPA